MNRPANTWTQWTCAEYARFPDDGNRSEVIDGEVLVAPAPGPHHQRVALRLIVVDPVERAALVWRFGPGTMETEPEPVRERVHWSPDPSLPAFHVDVPGVLA